MTDEPELPFDGLDAERPLPPELRARLEAALLAAVADGLPVPADARGLHQPPGTHAESLDAPRPLPEALRTRLESALLAEAAASPGAAPATEAAAPVGSVAARRRRKVVAAWSSVAAVLLLAVAVAGLAGRGGHSGTGSEVAAGTTTTVQTPVSVPSDTGVSGEAPPAAPGAAASPNSTVTTRATRRPSPSTTAPHVPTKAGDPTLTAPTGPTSPTSSQPGGATQPASGSGQQGPPPPFYGSTAPNGDSTSSAPAVSATPAPNSPSGGGSQGAAPPQDQKSATPPPAGAALRVGIVGGDAAQEAGFRAYIDRVNQSGGAGGHAIELVTVGPGAPGANTIATVNLSSQPVAGPGGAPGWVTGPLLETLTAPESLLAGNGSVFSFASAPERQGHLAADALFPSNAPGKKAVIYAAPSGPLHDVVPAAMQAVLEQRGVAVTIVEFDPTKRPAILPPADAALLSLDPAAARAWVADAKSAGYRPAAGIAGIYSLADDTLLPDLPEGARVVSPYVTPAGDEGQAIRSGAGGTSASVLHGWATAKSLAAAIWRTGADTPAELQGALEGLAGWSSGLAPAYETRTGTRSRTPEGVVLRVQSGAFVAESGFRRDPY